MKTGPVILIIVGLGIMAFLYFSPVAPSQAIEETNATEETVDASQEQSPEERVEEALNELRSGTTPPMQAILKIRAVAEEYPDNVMANYTLGTLSMQTGQFEKAVGRFESVLKAEPKNIDALQYLADAHLGLGDTAAAKNFLSKAVEVATDDEVKTNITSKLEKLSIN